MENLKFASEERPSWWKHEKILNSMIKPAPETLDVLATRPDLAPRLAPFISIEDFKRLGDPEFKKSERHKDIASQVSEIGEINKKDSRENWPVYREAFIKEVAHYLQDKLPEINKDYLRHITEHISYVQLDLYQYWRDFIESRSKLEVNAEFRGTYNPSLATIKIGIGSLAVELERCRTVGEQQTLVNDTVRHEFLHAVSYQQTWYPYSINKEGEQELVIKNMSARRSGIINKPFDTKECKLESLNEAITERINMEIGHKERGSYRVEREVLDLLLKKIDWQVFLKAYFTQQGLVGLAKEVKEKFGIKLSELDELMKQDLINSKDKRRYDFTTTKNRLMSS